MSKSKMKTAKWVFFSILLMLGMMSFSWLQQGCTGNYPPISAFVPPPFTATPTPGPIIMTFDGIGSVPTGWISALNSGSLTVPSLALSTAQNQENSCSSGCNSLLTGPLVFSAANQSVNIEYDFASTGKDLTGKTISLYYYLDAAPSNAPYGQIYIQDTPNYNYQSVGFSSVINGTWTKVSIPANQGGVNPAKILKFGVQIGTGGTGTTFNTVNFYVDNVTIQ